MSATITYDEETARRIVVEALRQASVHTIEEGDRVRRFLRGEADFSFDELELDSLARMEVCIAIEVKTGISIAPDELEPIGTVAGLVARVGSG